MSDLEIFSLEVLREKPYLGGNFSVSWDYWLIDEFQDTSPLQAELLDRLKGAAPSFVVGDPQQSIYLFRGAKSEMFHEQTVRARESGSRLDRLMINYRSEPALLEFLGDFFSEYSAQFERMQPRDPAGQSRPSVAAFISGPLQTDEDQGILAHITKLLQSGTRYDEICVLARTHGHLSEIATLIERTWTPGSSALAIRILAAPEILEAVSLLKYFVHPHDNLSLLTLFRSPFFRVKDDQLANWMERRPASLWTQLEKEQDPAVRRLRDLIALRRDVGLISAFEKGVRDSGMIDLAFQSDSSGRREANLWKLLSRVREEEMRPGFHALSLVEEVDGWMSDDESDDGDANSGQEPNFIRLMTIHGSKGLEFDHVIVPRMGTPPRLTNFDIFSHHEEHSMFSLPVFLPAEGKSVSTPLDRIRTARQRERELHEQDRWLYVALTRAKKSLALCWSDERLESDVVGGSRPA